jgi:hypothetical protein
VLSIENKRLLRRETLRLANLSGLRRVFFYFYFIFISLSQGSWAAQAACTGIACICTAARCFAHMQEIWETGGPWRWREGMNEKTLERIIQRIASRLACDMPLCTMAEVVKVER